MNKDTNTTKNESVEKINRIINLKNAIREIEKQIDANKKLLNTLINSENREIENYRKKMENYNNPKNSALEAYYMLNNNRLNSLEDNISKLKKENIRLETERERLIKKIGNIILNNDIGNTNSG